MSNPGNQLEVYYLDFSDKEEFEQKKKAKSAERILKNLFVPGYIVYDGINTAKKFSQATIQGAIKPINDYSVLDSYTNALGNQWVIRSNPLDAIGQYYVRHPKKLKANLLIESNLFNKYVYDEFCTELVNYCCTHCPAKSIKIVSNKITGARIGGGYKAVTAGIFADGNSTEVFSIESESELKHPAPLRHYIWLDSKLKQAIDTLPKGGHFYNYVDQDFSFGATADLFKYIRADLNYAHMFRFAIDIQC